MVGKEEERSAKLHRRPSRRRARGELARTLAGEGAARGRGIHIRKREWESAIGGQRQTGSLRAQAGMWNGVSVWHSAFSGCQSYGQTPL